MFKKLFFTKSGVFNTDFSQRGGLIKHHQNMKSREKTCMLKNPNTTSATRLVLKWQQFKTFKQWHIFVFQNCLKLCKCVIHFQCKLYAKYSCLYYQNYFSTLILHCSFICTVLVNIIIYDCICYHQFCIYTS